MKIKRTGFICTNQTSQLSYILFCFNFIELNHTVFWNFRSPYLVLFWRWLVIKDFYSCIYIRIIKQIDIHSIKLTQHTWSPKHAIMAAWSVLNFSDIYSSMELSVYKNHHQNHHHHQKSFFRSSTVDKGKPQMFPETNYTQLHLAIGFFFLWKRNITKTIDEQAATWLPIEKDNRYVQLLC